MIALSTLVDAKGNALREYFTYIFGISVTQSPSPKKNLFSLHIRYINIKSCSYLRYKAEIPAALNYGERLEHMLANQLVTCLYLYLVTIGNRQKALIRIPLKVKHITNCLCFKLKNKYKFSMITIFFLE